MRRPRRAAAATAAALALASTTLAAAAPAPDDPYEELVPVARRPLSSSGGWTPATLPTGWEALPCAALLSRPVASPLGPVVLCGGGGGGGGGGAPTLYASRGAGAALALTGLPPSASLDGAALAGAPTSANVDWTAALLLPAAGVYTLACSLAAATCAASVATGVPPPPAAVAATAAYPSVTRPGWVTVWATAPGADTVAYDLPPSAAAGAAAAVVAGPFGWGAAAVAYSAALGIVALGNDTKVAYLPAVAPSGAIPPTGWEWVSNVTSGDGGVYSDAVSALAFDDASGGVLYVGTPSALDVRLPDGAVYRVGGVGDGRWGGGLPAGNITSLAVAASSCLGDWPSPRLWLGTTAGVALLDPGAPTQYGAGSGAGSSHHRRSRHPVFAAAAAREASANPSSTAATAQPPLRQRWRYLYGPRYLVAGGPGALFGSGAGVVIVPDGNDTAVFDPGAGVATLQSQRWTLAAKAASYAALLPRHTRLGQVSTCAYPAFGVRTPCATGPDDNDGLWTSLTVAAQALRFAATRDPAALDAVWEHWGGMHLLMRATGIPGLISRSVLAPGSPTGSGGVWHNSTAPGLVGYLWKGDASSDEVVGHLVAYPLAAAALEAGGRPDDASAVRAALLDLVRYIVQNNFTLVDVTGAPTTWGRWDPATLNGRRDDWCDTRGLNSLQMLALLGAGLAAAPPGGPDASAFTAAWDALAGPGGAGYASNTLNQKVATPTDWNASDDELAALAYWAFFTAARNATPPLPAPAVATVAASLRRTLALLRPQRGGLWAALGALSLAAPLDDGAASDVLWGLRTWPLDPLDWPVLNSRRLDVLLNQRPNRDFAVGGDSLLAVLPANERPQTRWNSDPRDLDGGSGASESDPGAFSLMYWSAVSAGALQVAA